MRMMGAMTTHEAPPTRAAAVTHVMSEADTERVFPWDHEGPHTGAKQRDYGRAIPPSVKWIVAAEPFACRTCRGKGWWWFRTVQHDCTDCKGTGLPDVRIVSVRTERWGEGHIKTTTPHGVVPIGVAVPIVTMTSASADDFDLDRFIVAPVRHGETIVMPVLSNGVEYHITDEFGSQVAMPGMWAHPILT